MKPIWCIPEVNAQSQGLLSRVSAMGVDEACLASVQQDNRPIIFYGIVEGMKAMQKRCWWPGGATLAHWCDWRKLRCQVYYAKWGAYLLNRKYGFYPMSEVKRLATNLLEWPGLPEWYGGFVEDIGEAVFIRPDENDKRFDGMLVSLRNLKVWLGTACQNIDGGDMVVVARPERIVAEYRVVIADKKVIAASKYIQDECLVEEEGCPDAIRHFSELAAELWSPHRIFCLDVAVRGGDLAIIECGSINTCGLYQCKVEPIIEAMERIALEDFK